MKKWQDLAPPDDQNSWYDLNGFWPTERGTYEVCDAYTNSDVTATGVGTPVYAWCANATPSANYDPEYILDGAKIWQYQALSGATDRTGTATFPTVQDSLQFLQYGVVTIGCMGATRTGPTGGGLPGADTIYATSATSNFAVLSGAPRAMCGCVQSNAVLLFWTEDAGGGNIAEDGYAISDVGDYTNWTTGEATSGRLISTPGGVTAAIPFNNAVYAFKDSGAGDGSIYRLTYVGGVVKWATELLHQGVGCKYFKMAAAGKDGILFLGSVKTEAGSSNAVFYWFDGVSEPVVANPFTSIDGSNINSSAQGEIGIDYDPKRNTFSVWVGNGIVYWFNPATGAWGKYDTGVTDLIPVLGSNQSSQFTSGSRLTRAWRKSATNTLKLYTASGHASPAYIQTAKYGRPEKKTNFRRLIPLLRRRVDGGTDSVSLEMTLFREREDTTAQTTRTITESTERKRFDLQGGAATDNFARFKLTYTAIDAEIDDVLVDAKDAGTD